MTQEIEKILYKWFEMKYQTYDKLEHDGSIYLYYKGQVNADIVIDIEDGFIYYNWLLYHEFFEIIPIEIVEIKQVMSKWIEDTFNFKGLSLPYSHFATSQSLKLPN